MCYFPPALSLLPRFVKNSVPLREKNVLRGRLKWTCPLPFVDDYDGTVGSSAIVTGGESAGYEDERRG